MQLPGPGVWGPPRDHDEAVRVLRRAVELGVNFIDTADSYGPYVAEELIAEALHPYPADLVIATKAGLTRFGPVTRSGPSQWPPVGRPEYLRQEAEMSLRRMKLERLDLFQLHRIDPKVPFEDQIGELAKLQDEGKIRHIGLSGVSVGQLTDAREIVTVVSVQNQFNLADRSAEPVLDYCAGQGIAFIPYRPLTTGPLADAGSPLAELARKHDASAAQLALAWLLRRSPVMLPIPGTSSVEHLEDNIRGAALQLTDDDFAELLAAVP
jgi:aryl-alcohol dehydrogenase-like predicted oxidoreductase